MTLKQAIESKKPFKRRDHKEYFYHAWSSPNGFLVYDENMVSHVVTINDILADDWEIKTIPDEIWVKFYPDGRSYVIRNKNLANILTTDGAVIRRYLLAYDGG